MMNPTAGISPVIGAAIGAGLTLVLTSVTVAAPVPDTSKILLKPVLSGPVLSEPALSEPVLISQSFTPPPNSGAPPSTTAGASRSGGACERNQENLTVVTPLMPNAEQVSNAGDHEASAFEVAGSKASGSKASGSKASGSKGSGSKVTEPGVVSSRTANLGESGPRPQLQSLTLQARPSFFWHINPKTAGETASFLLIERDESQPKGQQHRLIYEAELELPSAAGIIRLDLPETVPALQGDRHYEWFLSFDCDRRSPGSVVDLSGWVKRVTPSAALAEQLQNATLTEQARQLAVSGIWQDALMTQVRLLESMALITSGDAPGHALGDVPASVQRETVANWQLFLSSVGLGEWAIAPFQPLKVTEISAYPSPASSALSLTTR